ncbi:efflux RND transporter periplasmic adaptor subunit [Flavobacterium sp.]|jgi:HlyD family secretion protein|uniref:efflux RND transporter periplasmic adaptor subunit n=1 Tax=Flavobacterium sp. TaxID=239 RepID=UPI0037BEB697
MSKKTLYVIIISVVVLILALIAMAKMGIIGNTKKGKEIEIAQVKEITIVETVSATGKIQPESEIKISSEVSGEIIELPIKEGDVVKKGQLLVRVNPDLYTSGLNRSMASLSNTKAGLSQAEAQLKESDANYKRNKSLFEKGVISKAEWDRIVATYESAKATRDAAYYNVRSASATVNEAQENLGRTTIFAPVDGTISKLDAELGERVVGTQQMAGTEIMRVANLNNMEVEVDVNENDIVKINIGDSAKIEVDAYLKKEFKGIVTSISNSASDAISVDQVTNFKVKVRILKESYLDLVEGKSENFSPFRPGMTATVDVITKRKEKVLAVPISSVVIKSDTTAVYSAETEDGDKEGAKEAVTSTKKLECVFVKVGGKAKIRIVKTGIQDDTYIEIVEGLKKGESIIVGPYTVVTKELNSGDFVYTTEEGKEKEKPKEQRKEKE